MKTIYKYTLEPKDMQDLELPSDAEVLNVQNQNENICMWIRLDPNAPTVHRTFAVFGTGRGIILNAKMEYIGTVQLNEGNLVFHVFEWV